MRVVAESFGLVGLLLGLLTFCGWWLARLSLPEHWRRLEYLVAPFAGLFWLDTVYHTLSWAGLPGSTILPLLVAFTAGLSALVWFRLGPPRLPVKTEWAVMACALPALLLALAPVIISGQLLPIGDTNGDPISYALMTEHMVSGSLKSQIPLDEGFKIWEPVFGMRRLGIRLGFHFLQVALDLVSGQPAHATFSVISAVGLFLGAQAIFILARQGLRFSPTVAYGSVLLAAVNAYLLWFHYGGYGPQALGSGLFALALAFWFATLRRPCLKCSVWAALTTAGLIGIYSEMLVPLVATIGLATSVRGITLAARKDAKGIKRCAMFLVAAAVLVFLLNPVAGARVVRRYTYLLDAGMGLGRGNVDWMVDLRCVLGLMPFGRYTGGIGAGFANLGYVLAGAAFLMGAGMIMGLVQVPRDARQAVFSLLIAHAALQAYFRCSGYTYGYFKGWGYGLPVYLILLSAGVYRSYRLLADTAWIRSAARLGAIAFLLLAAAVSVYLSLMMEDHLACTPGVAELSDGLRAIPAGASVYTVTGGPHRVRVFWIAHFLREHPAHYDARVIYTSETAREYTDEAYVLVQRDAPFNFETYDLEPELVWSGLEFDLYQVK